MHRGDQQSLTLWPGSVWSSSQSKSLEVEVPREQNVSWTNPEAQEIVNRVRAVVIQPTSRAENAKPCLSVCCHENERLCFPSNHSANMPPSSSLHSLLMRFDDARAAAAVLIVAPVSGSRLRKKHNNEINLMSFKVQKKMRHVRSAFQVLFLQVVLKLS